MTSYIQVPPDRLAPEILQSLLEDYASRDGTDYGALELTLEQKTGNLRRQIQDAALCILYDTDAQEWDLVVAEQARALLED